MELATLLSRWEHGWIAQLPSSLDNQATPEILQAACTAATADAAGIRVGSAHAVTLLHSAVDLPVIGEIKKLYPDSEVYLTPTMAEVEDLISSGADVIALDGTDARRPGYQAAFDFITRIKDKYPDQLVLADVSTFNEAMNCAAAGADFVQTRPTTGNCSSEVDRYTLISYLAQKCDARVIAGVPLEDTAQAVAACQAGAFALAVPVNWPCRIERLAAFQQALATEVETLRRNIL